VCVSVRVCVCVSVRVCVCVCVSLCVCVCSPVVRDQALPEPHLPEDVHGDVHGRVVGDREGAQVHDAAQAQGGRGVVGLGRGGVLREEHLGRADHALLVLTGIV